MIGQRLSPIEIGRNMNPMRILLLLLVLVNFPQAEGMAQDDRPQVFQAKMIWPGNAAPIQDAVLVVVDGKVQAIGKRADIQVPADAIVHDFANAHMIPGLVAAQTGLAGDDSEERTLTPFIRAVDGFDFFDDYDHLLRTGITSLQVSPSDVRLMPGMGGVVRLAEGDLSDRILMEKESLRIVLSEAARNPPTIYEPPVGPVSGDRPLEPTQPQLGSLTASLAGLRQIFRQAKSDESFVSQGSADQVIEAVRQVLESKLPIRITAKTTPEIYGAISPAKEFELSIILVDCEGLEPFAKVFEQWKSLVKGVILPGPIPGRITNPDVDQLDDNVLPWEYANELLEAGIPVAIRSSRDQDLPELLFTAGQFLAGDLEQQQALAAVTSVPATLMGVADQVGSLQPGCFADFVVMNQAPFRLHSRVDAVYLAGKSLGKEPAANGTTVIQAGSVYLGAGNYLDQGQVVIKGKTIRGVGEQVSAPLRSDVKVFGEGSVVVPGFVDLGSGLGMGGPLSGSVSLQTKLGEQLYADDPAVAFARKNGMTTALLSSSSGSVSPVVAFKLGDDLRVIGDPVAIRFKLDGDIASSLASNRRLLQAGKAYVDSWKKYEEELAEFTVKSAEAEKAKAEAAKKEAAEQKANAEKEKADEKKSGESGKEEAKPEADNEKKTPEKKDEKPQTPPPADLITGTWEGQLEAERLPPQMKVIKWELVLAGNKVTGTVEMMRASSEITAGSYEASTRQLTLSVERRGAVSTIAGKLDEEGKFQGEIELGRMGKITVSASRTIDKSKKPEPKPEKESDADKPNEVKAEKKDLPVGTQEKATESGKEITNELTPPKEPKKSEALDPYFDLFAGKIPAIVESDNLNAIKATAELFHKEFGLRTIVVGCEDLVRQPELLKHYEVSVIAKAPFLVTKDGNPPVNLPQLLANEHLKFGFQSGGTTGSGKLPSAIQYAVSQGLAPDDAVDGLTVDAAALLSENATFGAVKAGKDADLVVLSGPPFEFATKILAVMIDGEWVYQCEE